MKMDLLTLKNMKKMKNYNNQKVIKEIIDLFSELDNNDKEKIINEFILFLSNEDMLNMLPNTIELSELKKFNLPKYIDYKEIEKFLEEEE